VRKARITVTLRGLFVGSVCRRRRSILGSRARSPANGGFESVVQGFEVAWAMRWRRRERRQKGLVLIKRGRRVAVHVTGSTRNTDGKTVA
jgi:hypothetical protein